MNCLTSEGLKAYLLLPKASGGLSIQAAQRHQLQVEFKKVTVCFYCDQHTAFKHGQCLGTGKELCKNEQDPFFFLILFLYKERKGWACQAKTAEYRQR